MATKEKISHSLIPEHTIMSEKQVEKLLKQYNITKKQLPKISKKDPAIQHLDFSVGDVVMIKRKSPTAGESRYFRVIVEV